MTEGHTAVKIVLGLVVGYIATRIEVGADLSSDHRDHTLGTPTALKIEVKLRADVTLIQLRFAQGNKNIENVESNK